MDENGKTRSGWGPVAGLVLALVLYLLSAGPAYRLAYGDGRLRREAFDTVYSPVIWLSNSGFSPFDEWLTIYVLWWSPPIERIDGPGVI